MNHNGIRRFSIGALALMFSLNPALANPAKPGIVNLRQSDGTTIRTRIIGDEFFNTYLTEDGFPLVFNNGNYFYADIDGGKLESTGIRAVNAEQRTESHRKVLNTLDLSGLENYYNTSSARARMRNQPEIAPKSVLSGDRSRFMISNFRISASKRDW